MSLLMQLLGARRKPADPHAPACAYLPLPRGAAREDRTLMLRHPGPPDPLVFGPEPAMTLQRHGALFSGMSCEECGVMWAGRPGCWFCRRRAA